MSYLTHGKVFVPRHEIDVDPREYDRQIAEDCPSQDDVVEIRARHLDIPKIQES